MLDALLAAAFRHQARRAMRLAPSDGIVSDPVVPVFLYLHVPFCEVLCPYCSFHRVRFEQEKARRYFAALRREMRFYHDRGYRFSGTYVGGGTPTVLADELAGTLALLRELNPDLGEISVETNPNDLRDDVLSLLEAAGVARLSVGVQSFDDGLLEDMERREKYGSRTEILDRLAAAAGRFRTLNVDMIWNLPRQTPAMLESDVDTLIGSPANQASFYPLMTSRETARKMARRMGAPRQGRLRDYFERILHRLVPHFTATSAWCFTRGGQGIDEYIVDAPNYVGLGSGAFSYIDGTVYSTTFSLRNYVERVERGLTGVTGARRMSHREQMRYDLLVRLFGLRMQKDWIRARHGAGFERAMWPELSILRCLGDIAEDASGWSLTESGMFRWVQMMSAFFESVNMFREQMRHQIRDELDDPKLAEAVVPLAEIRRRPAGITRPR